MVEFILGMAGIVVVLTIVWYVFIYRGWNPFTGTKQNVDSDRGDLVRALVGFVLWTGCLALSCTSPDAIPPAEREENPPREAEAEVEAEAPSPEEVAVDWENHSPAVRQRIDSMATTKDCSGLQEEFDVADANDSAQRDRTGDGNADLMRYIHEKMNAAGCYE